jgi:hypothetical protein
MLYLTKPKSMIVKSRIIKTSGLCIAMTILLSLSYYSAYSQLKFPKEFKLLKGERGSGADDQYSNGKYTFDTEITFVDYQGSTKPDSIKRYLTNSFGFSFRTTKDGLFWGTGKDKDDGFYKYIVVTPKKQLIELYSKYNDSGFSYYSIWLLTNMRAYLKNGKDPSFPLRF